MAVWALLLLHLLRKLPKSLLLLASCREGVEGSPDILEIDLQAGHVVALTKRCHPKVELHFGYLQLAHEDIVAVNLPAPDIYIWEQALHGKISSGGGGKDPGWLQPGCG